MYFFFMKVYLNAKNCLKSTINYKGMWFKQKTIAKWSQYQSTETVYLFYL